jgi:replicative DNA helicase
MNQYYEEEAAVIGSIFTDNKVLDELTFLTSEMFTIESHRLIFIAIKELEKEELAIDEVTAGARLKEKNWLEQVGGYVYLSELVDAVPSVDNILEYAKIVEQNGIKDEFNKAFINRGKGTVQDLAEKSVKISEKLQESLNRGNGSEVEKLGKVALDFIPILEYRSENDKQAGISTGFPELDKFTGGLHNDTLTVLAARPGGGKTSLALNMANHISTKEKKKVLFISMEMSKEELLIRFLAQDSRIDSNNIRNGVLEPEDWDKLMRSVISYEESLFSLSDRPALTIGEIRSIAKKEYSKNGLDVLFVDYLQLAKGNQRNMVREQEISSISGGLTALSKELHIPVIALSQLNRSLEKRPDKRPIMSDLRESGSIEQDSSTILFLYRDELYNEARSIQIPRKITNKIKQKWNS